jgi:parallel beta-helix repeat protein
VANNNQISNNTISISGEGIRAFALGDYSNNKIINNLLLNNDHGLRIEAGSNWIIANNYVSGSKYELHSFFVEISRSIIRNNTILSNADGIQLWSGNNIIENNTISNNRGNGLSVGCHKNPSNENQIRNNKILNNK